MASPGWLADLWLFVTPTKGRSLRPTSLLRNGGSSYSEEPEVEILEHGEARLRNVAVPGRLRRPPGNAARPRALSSLHREGARPDRAGLEQCTGRTCARETRS